MEFSELESKFLLQLKSNDNKCIKTIEKNKKLVEEYLGKNANPTGINNFVDGFNNIVVEAKKSIVKNPLKLFEKVLKHPLFSQVLITFNNSDVLIKACKVGNKDVIKWLLSSMKVSPYVQDKDGMSALMYAAQCGFNFVIKPFLKDSRCLNLEDKDVNNVLYYAVRNSEFIDDKSDNQFALDLINSAININHFNHNGETILTYCSKYDKYNSICWYLIKNLDIDVNIADNNGFTPAMYIAERGMFKVFSSLNKRNCNYGYMDSHGQSVLSILIDKLYSKNNLSAPYEHYVKCLSILVNRQSDFNIPVDKEGNTAVMISEMLDDNITIAYCAQTLEKLDLSVKNKYGENITSLAVKFDRIKILKLLRSNPTFDYYYRDSINQNTLLILSAINNFTLTKELVENDPSIINEVNSKNENALIVATKVNNIEQIKLLLQYGINVNQQDELGNTALYYAVEMEEAYLVHLLVNKHADIHIKNNEGRSPFDLANKLGNQKVLIALNHPSANIEKPESKKPSKYEESIRQYLTPYITNNYPDYKISLDEQTKKKHIFYGLKEIEFINSLVVPY